MATPPLSNSLAAVKVSMALQDVARQLDERLTAIAGAPVSFSLFVWTDGRANYVANSTDRAEIKRVVLSVITGWDAGMPDVPAHEFKG